VTPDLHGLAGPYALDALDPSEQEVFEKHLEDCPDCAAEVRSLRDAAAELSHVSAAEPPPQLRRDVMSAIGRVRPSPPRTAEVIALRRARFARSAWQVMAAACAVIAIAVGAWGYQQHRDAERRPTASSASGVESILTADDAKLTAGAVGTGRATLVYSKKLGEVALLGRSLPGLGADQTYQLWMISGDGHQEYVSAGTFRPDGQGDVTTTATSSILAATARMGVSVEPAGGSRQPTHVIATMSI
jgi:anti-sigma-K factor RskA